MRQKDLLELGPKLEVSEIAAFESRLGFHLPQDYREFLLQTNGGMVPDATGHFYVREANWWIQIRFFFGLRRPDVQVYELDRVLERLQEQYAERFSRSSGKLPIATDDFGNRIYLALKEPDQGAVYLWMHNADDTDDRLSSSFGSFFESLHEEPD